MAPPKISDEDFIALWHRSGGSPQIVADSSAITLRAVYARRAFLAKKGIILGSRFNTAKTEWTDVGRAYPKQNDLLLMDGTIVVFSDAHWWPGHDRTVAHHALIEIIRELKPAAIINNGDAFDGARVSRHAPLGWAKLPSVKEELEVCQENLNELAIIGKNKSQLYWNIGNHDARFDRCLCQNAPEMEGAIERLEDRFPAWNMAWSLNVNDNTMVKHRYHNGIHATYNNTLKSGRNIVTGHLHRLAVTPWGDYNGRRYGVDTGTLAIPDGPQFDYAENNPSPHCSGFAVLTFKNGLMLPPELVEVIGGSAYFRGQTIWNS